MKDKKIVAVVAGTHKQYIDFISERTFPKTVRINLSSNWVEDESTKYFFANSPDKLRGFHGIEVLFIGTWMDLAEADEFEREARFARMT